MCDSFPPGLNSRPYDQGFKQKPLASRKRPAIEPLFLKEVTLGGRLTSQHIGGLVVLLKLFGGCFSSVVFSLGMLIGTFAHGRSYSFW